MRSHQRGNNIFLPQHRKLLFSPSMFILRYLISPFFLFFSPLYLNVVVAFIPLIISNLFGFQSRKAHAFLLWTLGRLLASEGFEEQRILPPLCLVLEGGTQSLSELSIPGPISYMLHDPCKQAVAAKEGQADTEQGCCWVDFVHLDLKVV